MNRWLSLSLSCLALGLLVAGCGGDDEGDGGGGQTAEQPAETSPATSGGVTVSMKDIKFVPMDVTVKAGGTIKWTNDDSIVHTVTKTSGPGAKFDSGNVSGGETFEQKFEETGKIDYFCTIHPQQTGTITVE
ncbi:MAG: cupredoxin domain-containing protein [Thermoleophilaceae bacterium]|nr:cupredoxin domain-containing protein [Thermoleophilaceae bacterium]